MSKNLAIIIPAYRAEKYLSDNKEIWKEVVKIVGQENVLLVEDSSDGLLEGISLEIGFRYFQKANGNWGSVINFVKGKFDTKYVMIVDADDSLSICELRKIIEAIDNGENSDIIQTKYYDVDYVSGRKVGNDRFWVHSVIVSTEIFNKIPKIPENVFFTDQHFMAAVENFAKTKVNIDCYLYNYFINVPGQSMEKTFSEAKYNSCVVLSRISLWAKEHNINLCVSNRDYNILFKWSHLDYLRQVYNHSSSEDRKKIRAHYNVIKSMQRPPFKKYLFWKMLRIRI